MYRTHHIYDLILKGVPESLRGELWFIFSGAANEVYFFAVFGLCFSVLNFVQITQFTVVV